MQILKFHTFSHFPASTIFGHINQNNLHTTRVTIRGKVGPEICWIFIIHGAYQGFTPSCDTTFFLRKNMVFFFFRFFFSTFYYLQPVEELSIGKKLYIIIYLFLTHAHTSDVIQFLRIMSLISVNFQNWIIYIIWTEFNSIPTIFTGFNKLLLNQLLHLYGSEF